MPASYPAPSYGSTPAPGDDSDPSLHPEVAALLAAAAASDPNAQATTSPSATPGLHPEVAALLAAAEASQADAAQGPPDAASRAALTHSQPSSQSYNAFDPTNSMTWGDKALSTFGMGMVNALRHAGNVVGIVSDRDLADAKAVDAPLEASGPPLMKSLGESAMLTPVTGGMGALADVFAPASGFLSTLGRLGSAAPVQGAAQGAMMADPGQRLQGAAMGAVGASLPAVAVGAGKFIVNGAARSPEAQLLLDAGVNLPPWQLQNTGPLNRTMQAAEHIPLVGDAIKSADSGALSDYVRATAAAAMPPGTTLSPAARSINQMVDEAATKYSAAYNGFNGIPVQTAPVQQGLAAVAAKARPGLDANGRQAAVSNLQDLLAEHLDAAQQGGAPLGQLDSGELLKFRSQIRDLIRGEPGDSNASRATESLYRDAEGQVTAALNAQLPASVSKALQDTDAQYAKFAILRNAAAASKDNPNGPSPYQIATAIARATNTNDYARGGGLGRDLSQAAVSTFSQDLPKTGATGWGRIGVPLMIATQTPMGEHAMAAAMAHPLLSIPPIVAGAAAMTPWARSAIAGNTGLQKAAGSALTGLQAAIPQSVQDVAGQYARALGGDLGARRSEQMPGSMPDSAAASADAFLRQLDRVEVDRRASQGQSLQ
jgi:hypothetical protein